MFGDFWQNFGLSFPFFGADAQGGMFAQYQSPQPAAGGPGNMRQAPTPPSPQNAPAASPGAPAGPSALASPLQPFGVRGLRRSSNVEDAREGSAYGNLKSMYGPGEEATLEGQLYEGGAEPEGVVRRGSFALNQRI